MSGHAMPGKISDRRLRGNSSGQIDFQRLASAVEALIRAAPANRGTAPQRQQNGENPAERNEGGGNKDGLTASQAARALRFALSRFAQADFCNDLAGFIVQAGNRAQTVRTTIAERRFRLAYQPVVSLTDRTLHHFEALLRPDQTADQLPAGQDGATMDFITFAEAVGLSEELDLAVLEQALETLRAAPGAKVAVNVSGLSIQSPAFRKRMLALIGGPIGSGPGNQQPARLMIELTETAEIENVAAAAATLDGLRGVGVPVCLDDFGAGAAAFRYLRDFRVDYIKIDGAYIRAAASGGRAGGFVASMRDLACSVGAQVIAEMIETEAQATQMAELGVQFGQGWLFGRPGALPGMEAGMEARR